MKVELHCHTTVSDGSYTFLELLDLAEKEEVGCLAVTNHDTTKDIVEMIAIGKERGIDIIPSIEISAFDFLRKRRVHILGYFIEPGHEAIEQLCSPLVTQRHQASLQMIDKLIAAGYEITLEQVMTYAEGGTGIYKQHIMRALIDQGYTSSYFGDLYKKLFSRGQNGMEVGIAYIPLEYVDAKAAVAAVRKAGGVPVLAHPGQYGNFEAVPELVEGGLQGIEVWHPLHDKEDETLAQELAHKYDLVMTGGSDFHGIYGEKDVTLGSKSPGASCLEELKQRKSTSD
ncbi:PHP domain-containing protein [Bacillaceae bacterium SIJ1]|uniref:PHP domain-containing protein n=1 Tax=Litoribacterium kuwaitense TaxID=1398745 RepID=UPI0013ECCBF8|nr:PHP domain-containing protein [Litoribacterium kuwaitense]NGP45093.1 PHP domain-containing protein [Litoribacterium kuwaitense]